MPPPPKDCPVPDCEYSTPVALGMYDLVYRDIELHTRYAHSDIRPPPATVGGAGSNSGPKADKLT
jgi:hypothetical protein